MLQVVPGSRFSTPRSPTSRLPLSHAGCCVQQGQPVMVLMTAVRAGSAALQLWKDQMHSQRPRPVNEVRTVAVFRRQLSLPR